MALSLTVDNRTRAGLRILQRRNTKQFAKDIDKFFDRESLLVAGHISKNLLSGQLLDTRTAILKRSITGKGVRVGGFPGMRVGVFTGPALAYAGIQEHGGTIKPKKAKALAVPTEDGGALTAAGVNRHVSPRDFPEKLVALSGKTSAGNFIGALYKKGQVDDLKKGQDLSDLIPVYLLLRKVTIKPKHYLREGMRSQLPLIAEALAKFVASKIRLGRTRRIG